MKQISFVYAGKKIDCQVEYSWRRSTSISIKPDGRVLVRAPKLVPLVMIEKLVKDRASWIFKKVQYFEQHATKKQEKEYVDGEIHHYLGKEYRLKIEELPEDSVKINVNTLHVTTKRPSPRIVKTLVKAWYHEQGIKTLYERYESACRIFAEEGIFPKSLTYKPMRGKWGTCSHDDHVCLNPELIKTPLECVDYVVYHELCHVRHHNHGSGFHRLMQKMMPDWKKRKKILDTYGIA